MTELASEVNISALVLPFLVETVLATSHTSSASQELAAIFVEGFTGWVGGSHPNKPMNKE
ncbi:MAG: hypothetical protein KJ725_07765 [Gammaproteobacteria bacterium]|nr:hypothetical protein [Gammaproteobacteria bacterium]